MTKAARRERDEAIDQLRGWIKPGDTVYTILDHVSSSGMSRAIRVVTFETECTQVNGQLVGKTFDRHPNYAVGKALGLRHWKRNGREQDALVVGGCGMDMGFHLVYELSHTLYGARLQPDIYKDSATTLNTDGTGPLLSREGAPAGQVYVGGYQCLGKGKCPSNYHSNHHDTIRCEGTTVWNNDGPNAGSRCYRPNDAIFGKVEPIPDTWPRQTITIDGETVKVGLLYCIQYDNLAEAPVGTTDLIVNEDGSAIQVCPTCKGAGRLPNPDGPERFDLVHTDGYALRHRWL